MGILEETFIAFLHNVELDIMKSRIKQRIKDIKFVRKELELQEDISTWNWCKKILRVCPSFVEHLKVMREIDKKLRNIRRN